MPNVSTPGAPAPAHSSRARQTATALLLVLAALLAAACGGEREAATVETAAAAEQGSQPDAAAGVRADGAFRIVATTTQASDLSRILAAGVSGIEITPLMAPPRRPPPLPADRVRHPRHERRRYGRLQRGFISKASSDTVFEALREQGTLIYSLSKPVKDGGFVIGGFGADQNQAGTDDPPLLVRPPQFGSSPSPTWRRPWPSSIPTMPTVTPPTPTAYNGQLRLPLCVGRTRACARCPRRSGTW